MSDGAAGPVAGLVAAGGDAGDGVPRPLRRDAEQNRERILVAARELFVERGVDVGVEEIARRAGVGMGTLYRRFPTKDALVEAILVPCVEDIRQLAERIAATESPQRALGSFLARVLATDPCHRLLLSPRTWHGAATRALVQDVLPLVAGMLDGAKQSGAVRVDLVLADVIMLLWSLMTVSELTASEAPEAWWRSLEIVLAGCRPDGRNRELPAPSAAFLAFGR